MAMRGDMISCRDLRSSDCQASGIPYATANIEWRGDGSVAVFTQWDIKADSFNHGGMRVYPPGSESAALLRGLFGVDQMTEPRVFTDAHVRRVIQIQVNAHAQEYER